MADTIKFDKPIAVNSPGLQLTTTRGFAIAILVVLSVNVADCRLWSNDSHPYGPYSNEKVEAPMSRYDTNIDAGLSDVKRPYYNRVLGFMQLRENWDGYGAEAVNRQALRNVIRVISQLTVNDLTNWNFYPSENGTILMTIKGKRLSTIDIGAIRFSYFASQMKGPNFCEGIEEFDVKNIINIISEIEQYFGLA